MLTRIPVQNTDRLALGKPAGSQVACALEIQGENPFVAFPPRPPARLSRAI